MKVFFMRTIMWKTRKPFLVKETGMLPYLKKKSSTTDHGFVRHCPTMDDRFINPKQLLKENGL
jgi:hypothetical protein